MKAIFVLVCLMLCTSTALADPSDCAPTAATHNTDNRIKVKLHEQSFTNWLYDENGTLGGLTLDEVIGATLHAIEEWNKGTAGREFVYDGVVTSPNPSCSYALIRAGEFVSGVFQAYDGGGTNASSCNGDTFVVSIPKRTASGQNRNWVPGDPSGVNQGPNWDLQAWLTHEVGHGTGVGDALTANGVMNSNNIRDVMEVDVDCTEVYYDDPQPRSLDYSTMSFSSGTYSTTTLSTSVWGRAGGVTAGGGSGSPNKFRGVTIGNSGLWADKYSSGQLYLGGATGFVPVPPIRGHRRELSPAYRDAVFVTSRNANNYGNRALETFSIKGYLSANAFDSTVSYIGDLRECTNASGFYGSCSQSVNVTSSRRLSIAYDDAVDRTVYAWVDQDRGNPSNDRDLRVAIGTYNSSYYNSLVTAPSSSLGKSDVSPGLACKEDQAGSGVYDCLIAYTRPDDPKNSIRLKGFLSWNIGTHWAPLPTSEYLFSSSGWHRTASPIALFYHSNKWWMAFKLALATGGGGVRLYSSTTGSTDSWTYETSVSYTSNGPTAISDWTGSNKLSWTK